MAIVKVSLTVFVDTSEYAEEGAATTPAAFAAQLVSDDFARGIKREVMDAGVDGAEVVDAAYHEAWHRAIVVVEGVRIPAADAD